MKRELNMRDIYVIGIGKWKGDRANEVIQFFKSGLSAALSPSAKYLPIK
jgi:hypothetical protein